MPSSLILPGTPPLDGVTYNGQEALDFFLEPAFEKPAITQWHTVDQNIKAKQQIAFLNRYAKTGINDSGCGDPVNQANLTASEKQWDPADILVELTQCQTDLQNLAFRLANGTGINRTDLNQNDAWFDMQQDFVTDNSVENALRRAYFGDTTTEASDLANGATDVPFYTNYNGFFKQITDGVAGNSIINISIAENGLGTVAAQKALGASTAFDTFEALVNNSDTRLAGMSGNVIVCSRNMYNNYASYLRRQGVDLSFQRIEDGFTSLDYNGIPVFEFNLWDRYAEDFIVGGAYGAKAPINFAFMTNPENMRFGIDAVGSLTQVDFIYDNIKREMITRVMSTEDVKILRDYLIIAAY